MPTAVNDVISATARMQAPGGQSVQNVWYFKCANGAPSDVNTMLDIAGFLDAQYTLLYPELSNQFDFLDIIGYNITQNRPLPNVGWPTLTTGVSVLTPLPPGLAGLGTVRTALPRTRGRKFFAGLTEQALDTDGNLTAAVALILANVMGIYLQTLIGGTSGSTWVPVIYSAVNGALNALEVTGETNPSYQRRRRLGTGI